MVKWAFCFLVCNLKPRVKKYVDFYKKISILIRLHSIRMKVGKITRDFDQHDKDGYDKEDK